MIQRLVDVLRALAAEPDGAPRPADLAGELADVLLLVVPAAPWMRWT